MIKEVAFEVTTVLLVSSGIVLSAYACALIQRKEQNTMSNNKYLYRCVARKDVNNGLVNECKFEGEFPEGFHHCPVCGNNLTLTTRGKSVSEYMQEGLRDHGKTK